MSKQIDLLKYQEFVKAVTSLPSNDLKEFMDRCDYLNTNSIVDGKQGPNVNVPLLLTAGLGLGSESGEFQEIIKKMFFQGKPLDEQNLFHMKRELGDIIWYWINACRALDLDPNEVIAENVRKLEARYPTGHFDAYYSENRKSNDL